LRNHGMRLSAFLPIVVLAALCVMAMARQNAASTATQPQGKSFAKPEDAASALYAAAHRNDEQALLVILGPNAKDIVEWTTDANERREKREMFAERYRQMHRLVKEPDNTIALYVGAENWPFPIPLIEYHGAWYFDTDLGKQEIRYRRIGRNEMSALQVCRTLVDAEKDYRAQQGQYTAKFVSDPNSHDGLYWQSAADSKESLIGPFLAHAGIVENGNENMQPFHGYYYRIVLQNAGADQKGEAFKIVAFPAEYRSSGIMTFVVDENGVAHEKDLGDQSGTRAKDVVASNPETSWKKVE
jgi:hypothetical protein